MPGDPRGWHPDRPWDFRPRRLIAGSRYSRDFRPACTDSTRDYPLLTGSALRSAFAQLLWSRLTSGSSFSTPLGVDSSWQTIRSPRVLTHSPSRLCLSDLRRSVPCKNWALHLLACSPAAPPLSASCSSGQRFAYSFLQIPPRDGHPCRSANTSPCRVCRGLPPPSECALPGAPK